MYTELFCRALLNVYRALLQGSFECIQGIRRKYLSGNTYLKMFDSNVFFVFDFFWVGMHCWRCLRWVCKSLQMSNAHLEGFQMLIWRVWRAVGFKKQKNPNPTMQMSIWINTQSLQMLIWSIRRDCVFIYCVCVGCANEHLDFYAIPPNAANEQLEGLRIYLLCVDVCVLCVRVCVCVCIAYWFTVCWCVCVWRIYSLRIDACAVCVWACTLRVVSVYALCVRETETLRLLGVYCVGPCAYTWLFCRALLNVYRALLQGSFESKEFGCILREALCFAGMPRVEWRGLKIGGGNLTHRKVVFCVFRCQSIWVGVSSDNLSSRIFWRNYKFQDKMS